jgi:hypothetical protein
MAGASLSVDHRGMRTPPPRDWATGRFRRDPDYGCGLRGASAFRGDLAAAMGGAATTGRWLSLILVATGSCDARQARRVADALRRAEGFAYRIGKEEFALLAPDTTPSAAYAQALAVHTSLAKGLLRRGPEVASGITVTDGSHDFDEVLDAARLALWRACAASR